MTQQPVPDNELITRLWELELSALALRAPITEQISPWYAELSEDAARIVRCVRLEAERLRNLATGEWPEDAGDEGDVEQGGGVLQTAASATDGGD